MNSKYNHSLSLANPSPNLSRQEKIYTFMGFSGLFILFLGLFNITLPNSSVFLTLGLILLTLGIVGYSWNMYTHKMSGIKNDHTWHRSLTNRGLCGWVSGVILTLFYIILYFYAEYLGLRQDGTRNTGVIALFDPLSNLIKGSPASQWFVYGTLYTIAILGFGFKFILKYRHNKYQIVRTISVMFFQLGFAFLIPEIMSGLNNGDNSSIPFYDLKSIWPLNYYLLYDWNVNNLINAGNIGMAMLFFGLATIFIISPILTYFYGKRWYCSWVCGCGGLAETAGDAFRQLSDKSIVAWRVERWVVHSVLVFSVLMTVATVSTYLGYYNDDGTPKYWINRSLFLYGTLTFLTILFVGVMVFKRNQLKSDAKIGTISYFALILGIFYIIKSNSFNNFTINKTVIIATIFVLAIVLAFFTYHYRRQLNKTTYISTFAILAIIPLSILYGFDKYNMPTDITVFNEGTLRTTYGFLIGSIFSGVIGTGFYPILGNRAWCRFGCPMAAILGLQQRLFSRFRITTNGGQCISCGNCSTYCEMGIDVRSYAQKGENIIRASCVGCGICSAVCPRGVLKLENGPQKGRINPTHVPLGNDIDLIQMLTPKQD